MRALPGSAHDHQARRLVRVLVLASACLLGASPARALDVDVELPRVRGDSVWIDVRLIDPLPPRVRESLARGMPATLQLHAELWKRRRGWFDRLVENVDAEIRIRFDVWNRTYRLERRGALPVRTASMDSLNLALTGPWSMPVARASAAAGGLHFVVVSAVLRPLTVEDAAEVESWLSGEVQTQRRSGFGLITQVPRALFDTVRNFAGFGDTRARSISDDFSVESLEDGS